MKKVVIRGGSWLGLVWSDKSSSIIEAYKNKGYAIEHKHGVWHKIN